MMHLEREPQTLFSASEHMLQGEVPQSPGLPYFVDMYVPTCGACKFKAMLGSVTCFQVPRILQPSSLFSNVFPLFVGNAILL